MRRIALTSAAVALLLLLGGVAVAGATPQAKPDDSITARILRFDVQFSDFFVVDVGEPNLSLGDYTVFHDQLFSMASGSATRAAPARSWISNRA